MHYDWLRLVMVLVPLEVGFSANSPKKQCGKSLDRLGNLVPDCLTSPGAVSNSYSTGACRDCSFVGGLHQQFR